jgi:hypothetical protein
LNELNVYRYLDNLYGTMILSILSHSMNPCSEETSEQLRQRLSAAELEKRKMAAEMGKVSEENESNLHRLEELRARLAAEAQDREKLQKRFDGEYAVFLERRGDFNETMRLRCVFCPQENQVLWLPLPAGRI